MELMAHPRTLQIMRVMIGNWLRLDHACGLQMTRETMWADAESLAPYRKLATTDLQRDLLRPPSVGGRSPLQFPEVVA